MSDYQLCHDTDEGARDEARLEAEYRRWYLNTDPQEDDGCPYCNDAIGACPVCDQCERCCTCPCCAVCDEVKVDKAGDVCDECAAENTPLTTTANQDLIAAMFAAAARGRREELRAALGVTA